jgi:hypothetical protein
VFVVVAQILTICQKISSPFLSFRHDVMFCKLRVSESKRTQTHYWHENVGPSLSLSSRAENCVWLTFHRTSLWLSRSRNDEEYCTEPFDNNVWALVRSDRSSFNEVSSGRLTVRKWWENKLWTQKYFHTLPDHFSSHRHLQHAVQMTEYLENILIEMLHILRQ